MSIGDNIRKLRLERGLTQKQLADSCGVADATIRAYELGKANPTTKTTAKIAKALDVSAAELYGLDWVPGIESQNLEIDSTLYKTIMSEEKGALSVNDPEKVRLIAAFDKLNKTGQAEALKRIEELTQLPVYVGVTPDSIIVGKKVKHARNKMGLTVNQLGEKCGLSEETILEIERGIICVRDLRTLSKALDVEMLDLLNLTPEEQKEVNEKRGFLKTCKDWGEEPNSDAYRAYQMLRNNVNAKLKEIEEAAKARLRAPGDNNK